MGTLLFLIATILKWVLSPFLYFYGVIRSIQLKEFQSWHKDLAISKDQHGNVLGKYFWNDTMIKRYSRNKFGNPDETMSSKYGKNELDNTLSKFGNFINKILNRLDENHSIKAIEFDES